MKPLSASSIWLTCWLLPLEQVLCGSAIEEIGRIYRHHHAVGSVSHGSTATFDDSSNDAFFSTAKALVFNAGADEIRVDLVRYKPLPYRQTTIPTDPLAGNTSISVNATTVQKWHSSYVTYTYSAYVIAIVATSACIFYMFWERGLLTCVAINCNVFALSVMSLLIRNIFVNNSFPYSQFVTASHAFVTGIVGFLVTYQRGKLRSVDLRTWCVGIFPVGCATALSLGFANLGLLYTNAHFYEMLGSSGFLITAAVGVAMGKPFHMELLLPMLAVTFGAVVLSFGEISFSMIGTIFILAGVFCRAAKAQMQSLLMSPSMNLMQLDPIELVTCTSCVTLTVMLSCSMATEGMQPWLHVCRPQLLAAIFLAAANAAVLNIASVFIIRSIGPVAQQCIGQFKGVLCCIGAVAAFGERITVQQALGYSIVICGIFWYNQQDLLLKVRKEEETELLK
jgi:drug/metabolite transporter (DMT)-like permease